MTATPDQTVQVWCSIKHNNFPDLRLFCHECVTMFSPDTKNFYVNQPIRLSQIQGIEASKTAPFLWFQDSTEYAVAQWTFPSLELRDKVFTRIRNEIGQAFAAAANPA